MNRLARTRGFTVAVAAALALGFPVATSGEGPKKAKTSVPVQAEPRDKWAVLVGVSNPKDTAFGQFNTADKSVTALAQCLKSEVGARFDSKHVLMLAGADATKDGINSAILESLTHKALPNDFIVIYFCGKIVPSSDHADAVFCSYDASSVEPSSSGVPLKRLLADLKSRTQSKQIICLLDTTRGNLPGADSIFQAQDLPTVEDIAKDCQVSVLSPDQLFDKISGASYDGLSLFCRHLVDGIEAGAGTVPLNQVSDFVMQNMRADFGKMNVPESPILALAQDNEVANLAFGCVVKASAFKGIRFGYPVSTLAQRRPDLLPVHAAPKAKENNDYDEVDLDALAHVDMKGYIAKVQSDIQSKWKPPGGVAEHKIVALFSILKDGTIVEPEIVEGSGVEAIDKSALDAIHDASPVSPLPTAAPKSIRIQYKFNWSVNHN